MVFMIAFEKVELCLSAPYLSSTCTKISTHPTPKCTQTQGYIKIQLVKVSVEFKFCIFKCFSIINIQHCNWEFVPLINNRGNVWYSIWLDACMNRFEFNSLFHKLVLWHLIKFFVMWCNSKFLIFLTLRLSLIESRFNFFIIFDTLLSLL